MSATATGTLTADGVRFERLYDATPEELWAAITDPEQIRGWLANVTRWSLTPGESWGLGFDDGGVDGRVVAVEPGRRLELTWVEGERAESLRSVDVEPHEGGARLVRAPPRLADGWQAHLEALDRVLLGEPEADWWARFEELRPVYAALAPPG